MMTKLPVKFSRMLMAICLSFLLTSQSPARWATFEEASVEFLSYTRNVLILASGKSEEVIEQKVKILNESGRNDYGIQRLIYNSNIEHIEILEAKTTYQGKEYTVDKKSIEVKPLASDGSGFDQMVQVLVSFPQVRPGSETSLKYKITTSKQPLPNYFASGFWFGQEGVWRQSHVNIKSELPFQHLVNDPKSILQVKQTQDKQYHILDISLQKAVYESGINEPDFSQIPQELKTWVTISTARTFEELGKEIAPNFINILNQPLPEVLESIKKTAQDIQDPIDQINHVTSSLSEKVRYMGDWRSIEGRYAPRPLKTIAESGFGDCKDFSVATGAILKSLGYKIHFALVNRHDAYLVPRKTLPSLGFFNHVMLKVTDKNGKVFWIDPTNTVSMANGLFPDIADRPTLLLDKDNPTYEQIPSIDYKHARFENEKTLQLKPGSLLHTQGVVRTFGEKNLMLTGATLSNSAQAVGEMIVHNLSGEATPISQHVQLPDLSSRICKDVSFSYDYEQENEVLLTNAGDGINLEASWANTYLNTSTDQVGTLFIDHPYTLKRKLLIKNVKVENLNNLNYHLKAPWVEAQRECRMVPEGIEIVENVSILKSFISADEVKTPSFKEFRTQLKKYCTKVAVIVNQQQSPQTSG